MKTLGPNKRSVFASVINNGEAVTIGSTEGVLKIFS